MSKAARSLNVFLCHGSEDKEQVRVLYSRLKAADCHPWLDEVDILPGKKWESEIRKAVRECDIILVCLSAKSADREGFVQKEIKVALDRADEMPPDRIFLIPVRLEDCQVPDRLKGWQWVDLFADDGFDKLARALVARAEEVDAKLSTVRTTPSVVAAVARPVDKLIADLSSKDPLLAMSAAEDLAECPDIIKKTIERPHPSMEPIPLAAVRRLLSTDPEASARLLCERVLTGDRDWHPARQAAHDLDVSHRSYCQDPLGRAFDRAGKDLTRILFYALGNLGANDWRFAMEERFYLDAEEYGGFALDGFTNLFLHARGRDIGGASASLRRAIERDSKSKNRRGLNQFSFRLTLIGCTGDHVDALMNEWLDSENSLIRELAVIVLGVCRFERSIPALEQRLRDDTNDKVKLSAAMALGTIATPEALEAILRYGAEPDGLAFAVHLVPGEGDFIQHATKLTQQPWHFRWAVLRAIGLRKATGFLTMLREMAYQRDFLERGCALVALARCGKPEDHRRIIAAHREASSDEQVLATLALLIIAPERYSQVESNLRDGLAKQSYMLWHPLREDIISVLVGVGSKEAIRLANAWRPFYGHIEA
jgi:hypothetical protein